MIVAAVADRFLEAAVRDQVNALLNGDTDDLTAGDLASRATWADKYRDSDRNTTRQRYEATQQWHFVDIELDSASIDGACFNHPRVPPNAPASKGPKNDCVVDKINQFKAELANAATSESESCWRSNFFSILSATFISPFIQPMTMIGEETASLLCSAAARLAYLCIPIGTRTSSSGSAGTITGSARRLRLNSRASAALGWPASRATGRSNPSKRRGMSPTGLAQRFPMSALSRASN